MIIDCEYYSDSSRISNSAIGWFLKKGPRYLKDMLDGKEEGISGKYLEKLGHVNTTELKHEHSLTEKIVDTILKDAMKLVMDVTAILLTVGLCLTLTLNDEKIRKRYNN